MLRRYINNYSESITSPVLAADTILEVSDSSKIEDALLGNDFIPLTLVHEDESIEIVHCVGASLGDLTVIRGQEGTTAIDFLSGSVVECRLTSKGIVEVPGYEIVQVSNVGSGGISSFDFEFDPSHEGSYEIEFKLTAPSSISELSLRVGTGDPVTYQSSTYYYGGYGTHYQSPATILGQNQNQIRIFRSGGIGTQTQNMTYGSIFINSPSSPTERSTIEYKTRYASSLVTGNGVRDVTEVLTGVRIFFEAANISEGSIFIVKKKVHL